VFRGPAIDKAKPDLAWRQRGAGHDEGLAVVAVCGKSIGVPVLTECSHRSPQCAHRREAVDILATIPPFPVRQQI